MSEATTSVEGGVGHTSATVGRCPRVSTSAPNRYEDSPYGSVEGSLTAAQIAALRATPQTLVPAPGTGKVLELLGGILILDYGTVGFTESADNLEVRYTNGSGTIASTTIEMTGFIDQTADKMIKILPVKDVILAANAALVLFNNGDGEFGNSGDSVIRYKILYAVHTTGL